MALDRLILARACLAVALFSSKGLPCGETTANQADAPERVQLLLARSGWNPGPNCFNTALLPYYPAMAQRYVSPAEFSYYTRRDFTEVAETRLGPSGYDLSAAVPADLFAFLASIGWDHAGYYLGNGEIFDRRGYKAQFPYRRIAVSLAHTGDEPPPGTSMEDRYSYRPEPLWEKLVIFRFTPVEKKPDPELPDEWKEPVGMVDLLAPRLRAVLVDRKLRLVDKAVEDTAILLAARIGQAVEVTNANDVKRLEARIGMGRLERVFEFLSLEDSYESFVAQTCFTSPYCNEDRHRRENASLLRPSVESAELLALTSGIYRLAKGSDPSAEQVKAIIEEAGRRYDRRQRADLHSLLP